MLIINNIPVLNIIPLFAPLALTLCHQPPKLPLNCEAKYTLLSTKISNFLQKYTFLTVWCASMFLPYTTRNIP